MCDNVPNLAKKPLGFVTPEDATLQFAEFRRPKGHIIAPHVHNPVKRSIVGTQEVLICVAGIIDLDVYASSGEHVETVRLYHGDVAILLSGAHSLTMVAESVFLEVKQGPYVGSADKTYLPGSRLGPPNLG